MAALLLVGSIAFALQVTAVTPLTASTSSQHIENQQIGLAKGILDAAIVNGSLRESVLYWNESAGRFEGATSEGYYATGGPPTTFGSMLNRSFGDQGIAFNVNVFYTTDGGDIRPEALVHTGTPSDHAISVRRTITLFDDDALTAPDSSTTLDSSSSFYAPDIASNNPLYNVIRVEVVVWRM